MSQMFSTAGLNIKPTELLLVLALAFTYEDDTFTENKQG